MRTSYTTLSVPKYFDAFSLLSHRLPWYQLKDEGFYTVWSDITTYCRCCHAEGHVVWNYPKNFHLMFVGTVVLMQILLLNAQKSRVSHLKRLRNLLLLRRIKWVKTKHNKTRLPQTLCLWFFHLQSQMIWSVNAPFKMNQTTLLVTTEKESTLLSTQNVLAALFPSNVNSQDDI